MKWLVKLLTVEQFNTLRIMSQSGAVWFLVFAVITGIARLIYSSTVLNILIIIFLIIYIIGMSIANTPIYYNKKGKLVKTKEETE